MLRCLCSTAQRDRCSWSRTGAAMHGTLSTASWPQVIASLAEQLLTIACSPGNVSQTSAASAPSGAAGNRCDIVESGNPSGWRPRPPGRGFRSWPGPPIVNLRHAALVIAQLHQDIFSELQTGTLTTPPAAVNDRPVMRCIHRALSTGVQQPYAEHGRNRRHGSLHRGHPAGSLRDCVLHR